jgi:hypothetical protein
MDSRTYNGKIWRMPFSSVTSSVLLTSFICTLRLSLARTRSCRRDRTICHCVLAGLFVVVTYFNSIPRVAWAASVAPEVLAFYYGWYGNPQVSGEWRHWKHVDPVNQRIENATDFPLYGAYDSHDLAVVEQQAEAARGAGITGFIASWWGRDSFEDRGMPLLLAASGKHKPWQYPLPHLPRCHFIPWRATLPRGRSESCKRRRLVCCTPRRWRLWSRANLLQVLASGPRKPSAWRNSGSDSLLEEDGFEPLVPREKGRRLSRSR